MKPDRFLIIDADPVESALRGLGGPYEDFKIITSSMAWDVELDKMCLMFSVFSDSDNKVYAQVVYLEDAKWVPAENIRQIPREELDQTVEKSE